MKYKVKFSQKVEEDFIQDIINIDKLVYPKEVQGTYNSIKERFLANPESYILLYTEENHLVGYICLFPISDDLKNKILNSEFMIDDSISKSDILEPNHPIQTLLIISVVVHPEYNGSFAIEKLTEGLDKWFEMKHNKGIFIDNLYSYAINQDGYNWLINYNLTPVKKLKDNSFLFEMDTTGKEKFISVLDDNNSIWWESEE